MFRSPSRDPKMKIVYSLCVLFCVVASACASDSILGCGGHVRAEGDLDLRKIVVKLLTKQGSLKYETDVAPNNGYFFLPVYDRGDYVVKVDPPEGWTFEPESIPISIDGSTDDCSTGKDLTFKFQGFSVLGKVTSGNSLTGPSDITVVLTSAKTSQEVSKTETGPEGDFMFPNVNHGQYYLHLSHPKWKTSPDASAKDKVAVSVDTGNGEVKPGQLQVLGFDVSGRVTSEGEAMKGVNFLLFGPDGVKLEGCTPGAPKNAESVGKMGDLALKCYVTSNEAGVFEFPVVPPGSFQLVPSFSMETAGTTLKFDVKPASLALEVTPNQGSVVFEEDFVVAGFGVTGHVLTSKDKASGLPGASILFNGQKVGETDSTGTYSVASVKAGEYSVEAQADGYQFEPLNVKISPKSPVLSDLVPSKVRICGKLGSSGLPGAVKVQDLSVEVEGGKTFSVSPDGSWCGYLPQGSYVIRVSLPSSAQGSGLSFAPYDRKVAVGDKPLTGLDFVQFKAIVAGKVSCTLGGEETCSGVTVHLKPKVVSNGFQPRSVELKPTPEDTFEFTDVLPGPYEVSVNGQGFCWDKTTSSIEVSASDIRNIAFKRTGVAVTFESSHPTDIDALVNGQVVKSFKLPGGEKEECFQNAGLYEFVPKGCHSFGDKGSVSVEVGKPAGHRVALKATKHVLSGSVKAEGAFMDLTIEMHEGDKVLGELGPLNPTQSGATFNYNFEFWAAPGDSLKIVPKASKLLFEPTEVRIVMKDDCISLANGPQFTAKIGLFFSGSISPPLEGVTVTVKKEGEDAGVEVSTGKDGRYVVGPLKDGKYSATAAKDGYDITAVEESKKSEPFAQKLDFSARKLAEISVVAASVEGEPLSGVLITVSGATDYRQNRLTDKDGRISFIGLAPGEYFVKPNLKEYKFDPTSVVATVKEGESLQVDARANRVAYSAFGSVVSLSNEPEPGITVEAIGNGPNDQCKQYAEEAATDQEGNFRVRGLLPNCNYVLKVKNAVGFEFSPAEGLPVAVSEHKDVKGLRLILFRPGTRMSVSATVITPEEDFLTSLRAVVFREDRPDVEITSKKLTKSSLFVLPVGLDRDVGKKYVLRLESNLPTNVWEYRTPEITFPADRSFRHFNIEFKPTRRSNDQDFKETSVIALPLMILVAFAVVNFSKVWPSIAGMVGRARSASPGPSGAQSSDAPDLSWIDSNAGLGKKKVKAKKI